MRMCATQLEVGDGWYVRSCMFGDGVKEEENEEEREEGKRKGKWNAKGKEETGWVDNEKNGKLRMWPLFLFSLFW